MQHLTNSVFSYDFSSVAFYGFYAYFDMKKSCFGKLL